MKEQSEYQKETIAAIREMTIKLGMSPTVRELCERLGGITPAAMNARLKYLKKKNLVTAQPGKSRSIRVVDDGGKCPLCGAEHATEAKPDRKRSKV